MSIRGAVVAALVLLSCAAAVADERQPPVSHDGLWSHISERAIEAKPGGQRVLFPRAFRTFALTMGALRSTLNQAPLEFTPGAAARSPVIALPMPDGTFARFAVQESPIMDPELAASLPTVRTYAAQGIDDPSASARLDVSPGGFHGFILSANGAIFIDPYRRGDTAHYISYWRRDYARPEGPAPFTCEVDRQRRDASDWRLTAESAGRVAPLTASGAVLRTYSLAMAATGEYTAYHGGTVANAQAAIVTTMNRVNGVYEREVAVRMVLVNNAAIVFTNAATDPYANTSGDLTQNQNTIDAVIGNANYDIGHLVGTGGGGVATLESVCWDGFKARGLTGSSSPIGDAFDIDYVAHEIGHQFGGNHTFNGTTGACSGNREPTAAYEPGSGSTIMAYAGICGSQNLQLHSDPYFHGKSYDEIVAYSTNTTPLWGGSCATETLTSNSAPVVSTGSPVTIPASTPFRLTGSAGDPNGDALTFGWEEFDLGTPIFRSFTPVTSPTRMFPKLSDVLAGTTTFGESLPATTRTMSFRLTARDNRAGGGGVDFATQTVNVSDAAGPFRITTPTTAVSWTGGSAQTITWDVANTDLPPVSCASVDILLSADGGTTFPATILAGTPNDGSQTITVPSVVTTTARIQVQCATSPFFNISRPNFTIVAGTAVPQNVVATALNASTVRLSWTGVAAATQYQIYRQAPGEAFALAATYVLPPELAGNTGTLTFDIAQPAATGRLYKMRALAGSTPSADSNIDLATTVIFTDDPLSAGTVVKAAHLAELRGAVNAVLALGGLDPVTVTDASLAGVSIKSVHITELRAALDLARVALVLPLATYSGPATAGTEIRAADIIELRNAAK